MLAAPSQTHRHDPGRADKENAQLNGLALRKLSGSCDAQALRATDTCAARRRAPGRGSPLPHRGGERQLVRDEGLHRSSCRRTLRCALRAGRSPARKEELLHPGAHPREALGALARHSCSCTHFSRYSSTRQTWLMGSSQWRSCRRACSSTRSSSRRCACLSLCTLRTSSRHVHTRTCSPAWFRHQQW